jgi:hypothetical protein
MVTRLLKQAVDEHELTFTARQKESFTCTNPKKRILEDEFAIRFPARQSESSCTASSTSSNTITSLLLLTDIEDNDFQLAVSLQDQLNRESVCEASENYSRQVGIHGPGKEGWTPPKGESKETQENEAAKALMSLKADYTPL